MIYKILRDNYTREANTTAYTAGDAVSDSATVPRCLKFAGAFPTPTVKAWLIGATITDSAVPTTNGQFRLWLFNGAAAVPDSGSAFDDNLALALPDGVVDGTTNRLLYVAEFDTWYSTGLASWSGNFPAPPIPIDPAGSDSLYGILSVANAYQSSANSNVLTVSLMLELDQ